MPNLTITLNAREVELITSALGNIEYDCQVWGNNKQAHVYELLRHKLVLTWVEQNPEDADLPWRA